MEELKRIENKAKFFELWRSKTFIDSLDDNELLEIVHTLPEKIDLMQLRQISLEGVTEEEQAIRGMKIIDVFAMPHNKKTDRVFTKWGNKTPIGIYAVCKRLIEEGK